MPDRLQQLLGGLLALASAPLQAVLALLIRLDSPGPALYRAVRVGEGGRLFVCFKLRTMVTPRGASAGVEAGPRGPAVSRGRDPRTTRIGRLLRSLRFDELPQLWNVARGEMNLVGPRPEDPRFVDLSDALHRQVFTARPGIAGLAQLLYVREGDLLDDVEDPDLVYRQQILPEKLRLDAAYLRHRSAGLDLWILRQTPLAVLGRPIVPPPEVSAELAAEQAEPQLAAPQLVAAPPPEVPSHA